MIARLLAFACLLLPVVAHADTRRDTFGSFDRIRIQAPYVVRLVTGKGSSALIEADRAALDRISLDLQGTTLTISAGSFDAHRGDSDSAVQPVITLTTPMLRSAVVYAGGQLTVAGMKSQRVDLYVGGSGGITVTAAEADELVATLLGSGTIALSGTAQRARLLASGQGTIDASALATNDLVARMDGPGEIKAAARATANVTTVGTGGITVLGKPSCTVNRVAGGPVVCGK